MHKSSFIIILALFATTCVRAQSDSAALLSEAAKKLENKSTTPSVILMDNKFLPIHPLATFREMIRNHANATILTITTESEPGNRILVKGKVINEKGPLKNVLVYVYQTDSRGWYAAAQPHVGGVEGDRRHARLFGYVLTDAEGNFELHTVKPSGYPNSDLPAHIHIEVSGAGIAARITELIFDDDPRLQGEIRERALREGFILGKPETARGFAQLFSYVIRVRD